MVLELAYSLKCCHLSHVDNKRATAGESSLVDGAGLAPMPSVVGQPIRHPIWGVRQCDASFVAYGLSQTDFMFNVHRHVFPQDSCCWHDGRLGSKLGIHLRGLQGAWASFFRPVSGRPSTHIAPDYPVRSGGWLVCQQGSTFVTGSDCLASTVDLLPSRPTVSTLSA